MMKTISLAGLLLAIITRIAYGGSIQPVLSIQTAVDNYIKSSLAMHDKYQIDLTPIDSRLQLPLCEQELQVFPQSGEIKAGRNTIGIRCNGSQTWLIYNIASIKIYKDVLVLSKPLRRKEVIRAEHLLSENRDISTLPQGYLLDANDVINKQASRNMLAGTVLNNMCYEELTLIKRGDSVNIQLGKSGIAITSTGTAMMDGVKGARIKVKNLSSQRQIQAIVVDAGQVSVNF